MENEEVKSKKLLWGIIIIFSSLLIVYLGVTMYFSDRLWIGTSINGVSVGGKKVDETNIKIKDTVAEYKLKIYGRYGFYGEINEKDFNLQYEFSDEIKDIQESQNPFLWFLSRNYNVLGKISYDDTLLKKNIDNLQCFKEEKIIYPKDAELKYDGDKFVLNPEIGGSKVNKDILYNAIVEAIKSEREDINLETIKSYENPKYTCKSKEVLSAMDILNKYVQTKITYIVEGNKEVLDGDLINTWLTVNENFNVNLNEEKAKNYIKGLSDKYSYGGETKDFITVSGTIVRVKDEEFGSGIDVNKETEELLSTINQGKVITKELSYVKKNIFNNDNNIGSTYVEIDLTKQHLWFFKEGNVIAEGNVVSGNVSSSHSTPPGIYKLDYKQKNAILTGPGYRTQVSFWMPFNGGIGIHDATWRSSFGGTIYQRNGSHGCINSPYKLAETVFNNIEVGTPVVCHY